jgi:hypothetical protein
MTTTPPSRWIGHHIQITDDGQWDSWIGPPNRGPCPMDAAARRVCSRNRAAAGRYIEATWLVAHNVLVRSAVGGALRHAIEQTRHMITIRPQEGTGAHRAHGSASSGLTIRSERELAAATPAGETARTLSGRPTLPALVGTGTGALSATVNFSPLQHGAVGWHSARPTFLHETFHAFQMIAGQRLTRSIHHYPNLEEWEAVMIQNMLCSEYGFVLRDGYSFVDPVFRHLADAMGVRSTPTPAASPAGEIRERTGERQMAEPAGVLDRALGAGAIPHDRLRDFSRHFARHYQSQIREFVHGSREFCRRVEALDRARVPFNPVWDMLHPSPGTP